MARKKKTGRVSEAAPVQVYLGSAERERLDRLAGRLGATKSEVLRKGLEALERQVTDPELHPLLRIIGLAGDAGRDDSDLGYDVAVEHDRFLADSEITSWGRKPGRGRRRAR